MSSPTGADQPAREAGPDSTGPDSTGQDLDGVSPEQTLVVGAAIVDDLGAPTTLLAARRREPAHMAGRWELPGGKVEDGELPQAGLRRELMEELGVEVELGREVQPAEGLVWPLPPSAVLRVWIARVVTGKPQPLEDHDELRLLGPGEWGAVDWLDADRPVVHALQAMAAGLRDAAEG